jgi:Protein of unknown function (DUF3007)
MLSIIALVQACFELERKVRLPLHFCQDEETVLRVLRFASRLRDVGSTDYFVNCFCCMGAVCVGMTYAQQLREYEDAVLQKRLEELSPDEIEALNEELEEGS